MLKLFRELLEHLQEVDCKLVDCGFYFEDNPDLEKLEISDLTDSAHDHFGEACIALKKLAKELGPVFVQEIKEFSVHGYESKGEPVTVGQ